MRLVATRTWWLTWQTNVPTYSFGKSMNFQGHHGNSYVWVDHPLTWCWMVMTSTGSNFGNGQHAACALDSPSIPLCWWMKATWVLMYILRLCLAWSILPDECGVMRSCAHCVQSTNFGTLLWNSYVFSIGFWLCQKYEFPRRWHKFVLFGQWRLVGSCVQSLKMWLRWKMRREDMS